MAARDKINIKLILFLLFFIISKISFAENYQKEIIPFKNSKIGLIKFTGDFFKQDTLFGIFQQFDKRGEKIHGTSFLALCYKNEDLEYEIIWRFNLSQKNSGDFTDFIIDDPNNNNVQHVIVTVATKNNTAPQTPILIFKKNKNSLTPVSFRFSSKFSNVLNISCIKKSTKNKNQYYIINDTFSNDVYLMKYHNSELDLKRVWYSEKSQNYFESLLLNTKKENYLVRANADQLQLLQLSTDSSKIRSNTLFEANGNIWDITNISKADINGDGVSELIIGCMNGGINLISMDKDSIFSTEIFSPDFQFDRFFIFDVDNDNKDDIITIDEDGKAIKSYSYGSQYDSFWSSHLLARTDMTGIQFQYFATKKKAGYFSYIFPEFMHHGILKLYWDSPEKYTTMASKEKKSDVYGNIFSEIDSLIDNYHKVKGVSVKLNIPKKHQIIEIKSKQPPPQKADFLLEPGMKFTQKVNLYSVSSENLNYTINAPEGMRFNLVDHSFIWQPGISQLGYHKIDAIFFWEDVEIKKEFTIYVNDPIEIINKLPVRNIIQAGEIFQYQLDIKDRNSDNVVNYKMTKYPEGATINSDGLITWKPENHQKDWYDFELTVDDGYSEDNLNFSLFVNYPLKIAAAKPINLPLGSHLNYPIRFQDNNDGYFLNQYNTPPMVENWQKSGVYETIILSSETKQILPKIITKINTDNQSIKGKNFTIKEVIFEQNKLVFLFVYNSKETPKFSEVFSTFFDAINVSIPNHTSYLSTPFYKYTLKECPEGVYITKEGIIKWKPDELNLGSNIISYTVSDDYYSDEGKLEIYVNDIPKVVSSPKRYANINEEYTYRLEIIDKNKTDYFSYFLIDSPQGAKLSTPGYLQWSVKETDDIDNYFKILITDGRDTVYHDFHVQINQKPIISPHDKMVAKTNRVFQYQISATDPEGGNLRYTAIQIPQSANFDSNKGLLFWRPGKSSIGKHEIIIEVKDEQGNIAREKFQLQVVPSKINIKNLSIFSASLGLTTLLIMLFV